MTRWLTVLVGALLAVLPDVASAQARRICVYDPAGKVGDYYRLIEEWGAEAAGWGAAVTLQPYTDEETARRDYDAGHCDGVLATGVRLQGYNRFPTTLEAIGGVPDYAWLQTLVGTLASNASVAARLRSGDHETAGILPIGAVYLFVRDRNIDSVAELSGKRIATLDYDKASAFMVKRINAVMVPADLSSLGPKFNNGEVDAAYVSAPAWKPFELWKGVGTKGGAVKLPLAQATLQLVIRAPKFPDGFGAKSRASLAAKFDRALAAVKKAEAEIPASVWITLPAASSPAFDAMFEDVRVELRGQGAYDGAMLKAMKATRCNKAPSRPECAEQPSRE